MISTHAFEPWHLDEFDIRPEYKHGEEYRAVMSQAVSTADSPAYTLANGLKPVGVVGAMYIYPRVMKAYALLSEDIKECPISFHKEVKRLIALYFEECNLTRMEIDVRCDFPQAKRWAGGLGFTLEGIRKNYGFDGSDHFLYARYN